jgi:hypothetical protein
MARSGGGAVTELGAESLDDLPYPISEGCSYNATPAMTKMQVTTVVGAEGLEPPGIFLVRAIQGLSTGHRE